MDIVTALLGEHAALYALFDYARTQSAVWSACEIHQMARTIESVMSPHARFEDEFLFDRLSVSNAGLQKTLAAMREEHKHLGALLADLRRAKNPPDELRAKLLHLVDTATEHNQVEERVLFDVARHHLAPSVIEDLGLQWARLRGLETPSVYPIP